MTATAGQHRQFANEHFTVLWMLPEGEPESGLGSTPVRVTVINHEGARITYNLSLRQGTSMAKRTIRLATGQRWSTLLVPNRSKTGSIVATLRRGTALVRQVAIEVGNSR